MTKLKQAGPDIEQLRAESLEAGPFPGGRSQLFRVAFSGSAHAEIHRHASESMEVEICGVLVGRWGIDETGPFLSIAHSIRGEAADNRFAEVTFTHETWAKINHQMDTTYSEWKIVGWYHTHPDFGIFLSDRDRFIQENFFSAPGQVAFVVDPVRKQEGLFVWRHGKPTLTSSYWIDDRLMIPSGAPEKSSGAAAPPAPISATARDSALGGGMLYPLLLALVMLLLGFFLGQQRTAWERQRVIEGTVAYFGLWKGLRPEMGDALEVVRQRLQATEKAVNELGALKDSRQLRDGIAKIAAELNQAALATAEIKRIYALSPEELAALNRIQLLARQQLDQALERRAADARIAGPGEPKKPDGSSGARAQPPKPDDNGAKKADVLPKEVR